MNGGKIMWIFDGTSAHMNNFTNGNFILDRNSLDLDSVLNNYGAQVNHDLIQDETCTKTVFKTPNGDVIAKWQYNPLLISDRNHIISSNVDSILTSFVSSIEILKPDKTTILLSSSDKSNILNEKEDVNIKIIMNPPKTFEGKKNSCSTYRR